MEPNVEKRMIDDFTLPPVVEPEQLEASLDSEQILVVDLTRPQVYLQLHVPGAVFLEYGELIATRPPVGGLLPEIELLEQRMIQLGVGDRWVVAYDDEGGGKAGRLIWTLHTLGYRRASLLNGGLHAWANEHFPVSREPSEPRPADFVVDELDDRVIADATFVLQHLNSEAVQLVDARTRDEFTGAKRYSARAGHIPGAIHWDWQEMLDPIRNLRLRSSEELQEMMAAKGLKLDAELVAYCQTHHRSSLSYVGLLHAGARNVRGYPGSWSDWGNRPDLPIAEGGQGRF